MQLSVDHLVHVVRDPEAARRSFSSTLGWQTLSGGQHVDWGTFNALCYFDLAYVEWVSVFDKQIARTSEFGRWVLNDLMKGEGVRQFALRTHHLDEIANAWRSRGLPFVGPLDGSRQREDGSVIRWRLLFPARPDATRFPLPFLIEWAESDAERQQDLVQRGALPVSGQSTRRLGAIHCVVNDPAATLKHWRAYFGDAVHETTPDALDHSSRLRIGEVDICFHTAATDELRTHLAAFGERPFQIDIRNSVRQQASQQHFQPGQHILHGLRIHGY